MKSEDNFGKHWYAYPELLDSKSEHSLQKSDTLTFFHKIYSLWSLKFECCKYKMFLKSAVFRRNNGYVRILTQTNWNDSLLLYHIFLLKSNVGRTRILNIFNREFGLIGCFSMHLKVFLVKTFEAFNWSTRLFNFKFRSNQSAEDLTMSAVCYWSAVICTLKNICSVWGSLFESLHFLLNS